MRITDQVRWAFDLLPEDVQAVLNLVFPEDHVSFESRFKAEAEGYVKSHYIDLWCDRQNGYIFVQDYQERERSIRRFVSWVRAGMPEGHNSINRQWVKED